ncbi:Mrp/NBP35 family ATP-binding protein [Natranaerobius trueperi]|uniref:Iron-sulfur cluster carrier protein n=1 Tax=Natranaerobius trueperi TaxID=759412 RepID=A0A226BZD0_9FIRM|nr:Mrp/NBP35 family ATP-binding protein [Natranaerobius trueperi]OWZ83684.1 ATP-binding protein [Natranaerobius trueperi]
MGMEKLSTNEGSSIKNIVAVMSGKGGVGKSFVSSLLASTLKGKGYRVGVLDTDITGPSIPKMFGVENEKPMADKDENILPVSSENGIKVMSINVLTEKKDDPVIWRGPLIANTVSQFYTDVAWGELDYLILDLPPGTGDVPLTVMQQIDLSGIVIVTSPQDVVDLIVKKSYRMAEMLSVPVLGIVENMSYLECPDCGKKIQVFGESKVDENNYEVGLDLTAKLPLKHDFATYADEGKMDSLRGPLQTFSEELVSKLQNK